jgi:hypothetical protein
MLCFHLCHVMFLVVLVSFILSCYVQMLCSNRFSHVTNSCITVFMSMNRLFKLFSSCHVLFLIVSESVLFLIVSEIRTGTGTETYDLREPGT